MMIPFLDLKQVNNPYNQAITNALTEVLASGNYILENYVQAFEEAYAHFCGTNYCIGVGNGSQAIELVVRAWDFPKDSEIIVPANTYIATILPLLHLHLKPVFVEPDPTTLLMDPLQIEKVITSKTKAIIPVHLYGKCCDMDSINQIAQHYQLKVLTDAAQAHGASYKGQPVGSLADAEAFSFYPTKNLGAIGDAGAIVTQDESLAIQLRALRNYGFTQKNIVDYTGINSRLDAIQAAVLSEKLPYLPIQNIRRKEIATQYLNGITLPALQLPDRTTEQEDAWHLFVIRHPERDRLQQYLLHKGIGTQIHYPIPPYRQAIFQQSDNQYPITDKLCAQLLSLPLHPALTDKEVSYIIATINNFR